MFNYVLWLNFVQYEKMNTHCVRQGTSPKGTQLYTREYQHTVIIIWGLIYRFARYLVQGYAIRSSDVENREQICVLGWPRMPLILGERVVIICAKRCKTCIWYLPKESVYVFPIFFYHDATAPVGQGLLINEDLWHTTLGRIPLDERSARRRDLYLTTHNTHKRQTSMPPVGFEPTIPASEKPHSDALDRAATGTAISYLISNNKQLIQLRLFS